VVQSVQSATSFSRSSPSPNHISVTNSRAGETVWKESMDGFPASPPFDRRTIQVVLDVVTRYDIDGVHVDGLLLSVQGKGQAGE